MAITDMKGTVTKNQPTMTGTMNTDTTKVTPPNLSQMNKLFEKKSKSTKVAEQPKQMPVDQSKEMELAEKVQNLTDQDKAVLATVLSPSVSSVFRKIAPELSPLLDQAGTSEENVIIPVSVVKNFATKRYGGQNDKEAITSFIADLQESVPNMDAEMDQPVPPEIEAIDQGLA
jgi:hypothetical protein|tara:strand:- start:48 stop:566 length:519 start_codon:yes stop_codon:yes gene_type:complete